MLLRFGSSKIMKVASTLAGLTTKWNGGLVKRAAHNMDQLNLDPANYFYLRNRAVSALELHGPNQNSDAFEYDELQQKYSTFIGKNISVDHIGTNKIGIVLDSEFMPSPQERAGFGLPMMPLEASITSLNNLCTHNKDTFGVVRAYAEKNELVRGSDQKMLVEVVCRRLNTCGWVENIWAIERRAAEKHTPGMTDAILDGSISDSSMGTLVEQAICSVCGNIATGELPEHEDFCDHIRLHKGKQFPIQGMIVIPFEINRGIEFFEDSLILPFRFGGKAGGEGADRDAKLLEVFATKKTAYTETTRSFSPNVPSNTSQNLYILVGDMPELVEKNRTEFIDEKKAETQEHIDEQNAPGKYPEGTLIHIMYEDEDTLVSVVDEFEDGKLVVAMEGLDEPIEITVTDIIKDAEVIYPENMDYEDRMEADDGTMQMAASKTK